MLWQSLPAPPPPGVLARAVADSVEKAAVHLGERASCRPQDQYDRDQTLADFKNGVCSLLIATSVLSRGLDVKNLNLVVNYDVPNHMEDYVHRCGRTGRGA